MTYIGEMHIIHLPCWDSSQLLCINQFIIHISKVLLCYLVNVTKATEYSTRK